MSVAQILQVLIIVDNAIADALVGELQKEKIGGALDILGMLELKLAECSGGGSHD